jgi:putative molybdopterin biosynthesis protein
MPTSSAENLPDFMTTREVADLLRVKERKVYHLAAEDEIPHRRVTGKLLFPRGELMAWINGDAADGATDPPAVITG